MNAPYQNNKAPNYIKRTDKPDYEERNSNSAPRSKSDSAHSRSDTPRYSPAPQKKAEPHGKIDYRKNVNPKSKADSSNNAEEDGIFLPGVKPVLELLEASPEKIDMIFLRKGRHGQEMDTILDLCRDFGVRFSLLDPSSFSRVYAGSSQGVVARLYQTGFMELEDLLERVMDNPLPLIFALDQVQDPGNAGTLARTVYALGGAGLIVPRHNGVFLGAGATRAAAGALEHLPVSKVGNLGQALDAAKKQGLTIYGASAEIKPVVGQKVEGQKWESSDTLPSQSIFELSPRLPAVLVLGSEESGLRPNILKRCDALLHIPMLRDFDSINVAQAGGIIAAFFAKEYLGKKNKG